MRGDWNDLQNRLKNGALNRRDFLAAAGALGITGTAATDALAQVPKRGGHLVLGLIGGATTDSLDTAYYVASYMNVLGKQVYDSLTSVDDKLVVQPALAESWDSRNGATEWVFKLRKGVTFHNGKTVTPADVVYSLNHHRGPDSKSLNKTYLADVTDILISGPDEVTFKLSGGNVDFPYHVADWHMVIVPADGPFNGMGTGAFVLEKMEPGVRTVTRRNPNDWKPNRGYVDSVETIVINDTAARLSALLSGSVHLIDQVPYSSVDQLQKAPNLQLLTIAGPIHIIQVMDTSTAPFDNLDLRLAIKYGIDRETILKTGYRGYAYLGNDHPVPRFNPFFAADIPQRKYDPDQARFHYKKSGHSGPLSFITADASQIGPAIEVAEIFSASAKKAGIDIQINRVPNDGYYSKYFAKAQFYQALWSGRPTANLILSGQNFSGAPSNEAHFKSPKFDQLAIAARAESDFAKRKQMYHDMQLIVRDEGGHCIPIFKNTIDGGSKKVKGFVPSPYQEMAGLRAPEMVWLDG